MNHWDSSPITQTNEVAGNVTPRDNSPQDRKPSSRSEMKYGLLSDDLQKIRRSNHSSHQQKRQDAMEDDEHDGIIKGLLYPGLEDGSDTDFDFFEEDYNAAQAMIQDSNRESAAAASSGNSVYSDLADNHAIHRRTLDLSAFDDNEADSYYASYFASMGRPYSDLSSQKLRR